MKPYIFHLPNILKAKGQKYNHLLCVSAYACIFYLFLYRCPLSQQCRMNVMGTKLFFPGRPLLHLANSNRTGHTQTQGEEGDQVIKSKRTYNDSPTFFEKNRIICMLLQIERRHHLHLHRPHDEPERVSFVLERPDLVCFTFWKKYAIKTGPARGFCGRITS